MENYQRP